MWKYRFLYRDLDQLTSHDVKLGARFGALLRKGSATVLQFCRGLAEAGTMRASDREIEALAQNVVLVASYWSLYDRVRRGTPAEPQADAGRAAYQVFALFAPYLVGNARAYVDRLAADYL